MRVYQLHRENENASSQNLFQAGHHLLQPPAEWGCPDQLPSLTSFGGGVGLEDLSPQLVTSINIILPALNCSRGILIFHLEEVPAQFKEWPSELGGASKSPSIMVEAPPPLSRSISTLLASAGSKWDSSSYCPRWSSPTTWKWQYCQYWGSHSSEIYNFLLVSKLLGLETRFHLEKVPAQSMDHFARPRMEKSHSGRRFPTNDFLVLPGSKSTITQIIEYRYFSPLKPSREMKHESE